MNQEWLWIAIGFLGQALFSARFMVQWIASERAKRSIVPKAFWFFSLGGGATLLAYALYRQDPVFIVGQGTGLFIYVRNLMLLRREERNTAQNAPHEP
ncbi:lipid-A-disaccharide synthase N-terminal domain-containing protein [Halomonas sp. HP20-15]|uniref:lipid-A-disaccharide synthase N-terminal domain-containing protein n=1 Tax=Halomonas sp. HP20-15 TaxID=3085901 RepID=UPI002981AB05|nr:lipid-A-disaccharide synthase N-terminal domain-containing protein [Halomonas sp. HP20-15]MDW5377827.1 lipid-A-disaccharide synthase N-terminal domain-containing protein [Halomonas sp. HP20-15]